MTNLKNKKDKDRIGFYWIAEFDNGDIIEQYTPNYTEIMYKEVLDRVDNLIKFSVVYNTELYEVDILKCKFKTPTKTYNLKGDFVKHIYYRRNKPRVDIFDNDKQLPPQTKTYIGLETTEDKVVVELFIGQGQKPKKEKTKEEKKIQRKPFPSVLSALKV